MTKNKRRKRIVTGFFLVVMVVFVVKIIFSLQYKERIIAAYGEKTAAVYYLLNIDGMKGLGNSLCKIIELKNRNKRRKICLRKLI